MWWRVSLRVAFVALALMALFAAPLWKGRMAWQHRSKICHATICNVVPTHDGGSSSSSSSGPLVSVVYPTDADCSYRCRDTPLALWQCGGENGDVGVWFVWHGDSIARRTFLDVFETVAARLVFDLAALDRFCRRFDFVHEHRKCVFYDVVLQLPDDRRRLIRLTYVAKHRVGDRFEWADLSHFEGRAWLAPALLVVNSGLWDLLYERNVTAYNTNLPLALDHAFASRARTIVWMAIPALDAEHLPEWKSAFLTESAIRSYNNYTLGVIRDRSSATPAPPPIRFLDTFALTDFKSTLAFGHTTQLNSVQQAELFRTEDGIHRPGPISRTIAQLQLELSCHL